MIFKKKYSLDEVLYGGIPAEAANAALGTAGLGGGIKLAVSSREVDPKTSIMMSRKTVKVIHKDHHHDIQKDSDGDTPRPQSLYPGIQSR